MAMLALVAATHAAESNNGLQVTLPNGYANVEVIDLVVYTPVGDVQWRRVWDGREWKFNPQWESLSQSWKNLTGNQTADTTAPTQTPSPTSPTSPTAPTVSASVDSPPPKESSCWVWVDEDWEPSTGTVVVGGETQVVAGPLLPARSTPFNRLMGEEGGGAEYAQPQRVSVDYATLCMGSSMATSQGVPDLEGIRRVNELYLGESGRYAFDNRSILEKKAVTQVPAIASSDVYARMARGETFSERQNNDKGYRWTDRGGSWVQYNTQGQVVAWGDRNGNTVWLVRDAQGLVRGALDTAGRPLYSLHYTGDRLTEVRDYPNPSNTLDMPQRSVSYAYDDKNRLSTVTNALGHVVRYHYDQGNNIVGIEDAEGRTESLKYAGGVVKQRTTPDGAVTDYLFEFDDVNKQFFSKISGPETAAGRYVEEHVHNRVGKMVRRTVNGRVDAEVRHDTGSRAETYVNARGFATTIRRDEFDQAVETVYPDGGRDRREYSAANLRLLRKVDPNGAVSEFSYDDKGNIARWVQGAGTPVSVTTRYETDAAGQVVKVIREGRTESNGTVTPDAELRLEYDIHGNLSKAIDPEGGVHGYVHDRGGYVRQYTDPLGRVVNYDVDKHGNLTRYTNALQSSIVVTTDKVGNLVRFRDSRGKDTTFTYDGMDRELSETDPSGATYTTAYDGYGATVHESDPDGRGQRLEYDAFQRLVRTMDAAKHTTTYGYQHDEALGTDRPSSLTLPARTQYPTFSELVRFDERERPTSRTFLNPTSTGVEGLVTSTKYDRNGNVTETTDAQGKTTFRAYDALGRPTSITNSLGKRLEFTWDTRSNLIAFKDFEGKVSSYTYDRANRMLTERSPLGQTKTYAYDAKGNRRSVTDPSGARVEYTYDAGDLPVRTDVFAAGASSPAFSYTFEHDLNGELVGWSDGTRSARLRLDDMGRLLSQSIDYGGTTLSHGYTYTPAGKVRTVTYPSGNEVTLGFNAADRLETMELPGEGTIAVTSWNWLAPVTTVLPGGVTRETSTDGLLRPTSMRVKGSGQQTLFDLASKHSRVDQVLSKTLTDMTTSGASRTEVNEYAYDDEGRLVQHVKDTGGLSGRQTETIGFDAADNRILHSAVSGTWVYDDDNRLLQRGDVRYEYNADGYLSQIRTGTSGTPASIQRFRYDALGRLVQVRDGADQPIAEYAYDPFDNRLVKDVFRRNGAALATPERTLYVHGEEGLLAEADGTGAVRAEYGWDPNSDWQTNPVFIRTRGTGDAADTFRYAYFHNDHIGTPLRATDKAGVVVWRADYTSDGVATLAAENQIESNLRFPGQYHDAETGLHYNLRRYYDPKAARYITPDPLGIDGSFNLYGYAGADPINQTDPTGEIVPAVVAVWRAIVILERVVTFVEVIRSGCVDWVDLIPMAKMLKRVKWVQKLMRRCNSCLCGKNSFTADTLVHVQGPDGKPATKAIADIRVGDLVLAKSEWKAEGQNIDYQAVADVFVTPDQRRTLVRITFEGGATLTATDGHPFRTEAGWRDAILLAPGDRVLLSDDIGGAPRVATVKAASSFEERVTTYNLEVANSHTFYVGEDAALVHNGHGSYTIHFPDGTRYHGKGDRERAKRSARRVGRATGNFCDKDMDKYTDWIDYTDAASDEEAHRQEFDRINKDGGPSHPKRTGAPGKPNNWNKIWPPGHAGGRRH
ncbi:hypothetical protein A4W93_08865 [Piscinibacter gummiphilus]|uniref:Hint domain-containing protein n=2 Tax=Piscinibacter gummiphilus TaxID=946333 RepID=A0A1W6L736_9BURK|nr:hypothetical protein A4W93_08865 [Piscinibacter gummiphilus]